MLTTDQIRESFLAHFESKDHKRLPADNLVPQNDPTLLFTGAGMNQFKAQFNGIGIEYPRVTTSQTCIRTGDIENVGKTPRHHTFFEMLGFFSFGDFFKKEAISWIWEFYTEKMKIPVEKLSISIYLDDDEAFGYWEPIVGADKITRLGEDDNFWPAGAPSKGPNGVCGPCSEIFYDMGDQGCTDSKCQAGCDCGRYLEIGNIVFTQFDRQSDGRLEPLPQKNIDFGGGLERLAAVVQGVSSNFEIDILKDLGDRIQKGLGLEGELSPENTSRLRRIVDHLRTVAFCIAEGVKPSPNNQGYVIRRLLRRAILDVNELGVNEPVLYQFVKDVSDVMKGGYPELVDENDRVSAVVREEEISFLRTLRSGRQKLMGQIDKLTEDKEKVFPGDIAFELYSTYGFPYELTEEFAENNGLTVDKKGYQKALEEDKKLSQKSTKISADVFVESPAQTAKKFTGDTEFIGYDSLSNTTKIEVLFDQKEKVESLKQGEKGLLVVPETPFYAESGGQLGDKGLGTTSSGQLAIYDTQKEAGIFLHSIVVKEGEIKAGDEVTLEVSAAHREATMANHSVTHLTQWALREVLGPEVGQAGSQVGPDTMRYDFSYSNPLTQEEIDKVESLVNAQIWASQVSNCQEMTIEEARKTGAIAMFGEKYGDIVRIVTLGDSIEFCGGTHVPNTGFIGAFKIISQESVGSGVRRITGVTREKAIAWQREKVNLLNESARAIKASVEDLPKRVGELAGENQKLKKELQAIKKAQSAEAGKGLKDKAEDISGMSVLIEKIEEDTNPMDIADQLKGQIDVIFLAAAGRDRVNLLISCSEKAQKSGLKSGDLLKKVASCVDGKGGGKPALARGSGKKPAGIEEAFGELRKCLQAVG